MRCFRGVVIAALSFMSVYGRPENLYSFDSLEPGFTDPTSADLFLDSPELDSFSSVDLIDPLDQDSTTESWDFASLPNCETQGSLIDDFLQARDGTSCPPKEPEGNVNLPTGLFQDPLQFLNDGLQTPPVGQNDQPDSGIQDLNFDFNAFVRNRPKSILNYPEDNSICPPQMYGLSTTPVCHYSNRGSSPSDGQEGGLTLYDVSPCRYFILGFRSRME